MNKQRSVCDRVPGSKLFVLITLAWFKQYLFGEGVLWYCVCLFCCLLFEPRSEKTGLRGFQPGPTQTGLRNH